MSGAAMVQWNHACFGILRVSKRTGSNPVHGLRVDSSTVAYGVVAYLRIFFGNTKSYDVRKLYNTFLLYVDSKNEQQRKLYNTFLLYYVDSKNEQQIFVYLTPTQRPGSEHFQDPQDQ
ncbi:hypothetical protein E2C01_028210 [Portunus trituberculatus]|uniref:Uncharacterized protein n=1 Tax=Portunus trituberculatus TaxID=210409 RepID=A0A5B7ENA5_PORTR|nr:hypothetical protein [Portunus trituberculatus]